MNQKECQNNYSSLNKNISHFFYENEQKLKTKYDLQQKNNYNIRSDGSTRWTKECQKH